MKKDQYKLRMHLMKWLPSSERQFVEMLLDSGSIDDNIWRVWLHQNLFANLSFSAVFLVDLGLKGSVLAQISIDIMDRSVVFLLLTMDLGVKVPLSWL